MRFDSLDAACLSQSALNKMRRDKPHTHFLMQTGYLSQFVVATLLPAVSIQK